MNIIIKEVKTVKETKQFIDFPNQLYKNSKLYIPPLSNSEKNIFNPNKNAAFQFCDAKLWLAYKNNRIVGRIAGIINRKYNKERNENKARFGWVDFEEDTEIIKALIKTVEKWAIEQEINLLHGPLGFNSLDASGVLVEGFDELPTSFGHYNFPYYNEMFKKIGFEKEIDWVEYRINVPDILPEKIFKLADIVKQRYKIKELKFNSKKELLKYTDEFFNILNKSYSNLFAFSELVEEQKKQMAKEFFSIIKLDYISFLVDENDKLVAFGISTPSMAKAIKKANGKLFPFGFLYIMQAFRKNDTAELLLVGIDKQYQNKGLTAIIFSKIMKTFVKNGIKYVETTRELENNKNVQQLWSKYDYRQHKRARCYIKAI